jgi:tartrate dehydrogenase/decarboxylase/D-malate dehydrogenase
VPDTVTVQGLLHHAASLTSTNLRPAVLYDGVASPLAGKAPGSIDMIVVRENTEGEYAQAGGRHYQGLRTRSAIQSSIFTPRLRAHHPRCF